MKWQRTASKSSAAKAGFTLAEVLAALLFMAIVIPVALEGLRIASHAGQVAERKAVAARVGESILAQHASATGMNQSLQNGSVMEKQVAYEWRLESRASELGNLRELTVEVVFPVQDREHVVRLTTLVKDR
jgi:type II secretory pathway pseudopilin PulG